MMTESPDGEIGRRSGLKIRGPETAVGVQVPLRAPNCMAIRDESSFGSESLGKVARIGALRRN